MLSPIIFLLAAPISIANAYSMGAPDSACQRMTPGHGFDKQSGAAPYRLSISPLRILPGQFVDVRLEGVEGQTFKGFLVQARLSSDGTTIVGNFESDEANYNTCGRGIHNSITHKKSEPKTSVRAQWKAPDDFDGQIFFRYSALQDYSTYWVGLESERVLVARSASVTVAPTVSQLSSAAATTGSQSSLVISATTNEAPPPSPETVTSEATSMKTKATTTATTTIYVPKLPQPRVPKTQASAPQSQPRGPSPAAAAATLPRNDAVYDNCAGVPPLDDVEECTLLRERNGLCTRRSDKQLPSKTCFGMGPSGGGPECLKTRSCKVVLAYYFIRGRVAFELAGLGDGYLAVGLSHDARMGGDLTTSCIYDRNSGIVSVIGGFNDGYSNSPLSKPGQALEDMSGKLEDGRLSCKFKRPQAFAVTMPSLRPRTYDLQANKYFIFLAEGDTYSENNGRRVAKHNYKIVSGAAQSLGVVAQIVGKQFVKVKLHGAFMVAAWIFAASMGMLIARYFKQTWTGCNVCGLDLWFHCHRFFMILTWALTIAGFILIFLELDGWTAIPVTENPHAVLGCVTTGLCFMQPLIAILRCKPSAARRPLFNWVHWFVGNSAQIVGVAAIFYAQKLSKAQLPKVTDWILVGFVAFHFLTHVVMSCLMCNSDAARGSAYKPAGHSSSSAAAAAAAAGSYPMRNLHGGRAAAGIPFPDYEELKRDAAGSSARSLILAVYAFGCAAAAAVIILLIIFAPTTTQIKEQLGIIDDDVYPKYPNGALA